MAAEQLALISTLSNLLRNSAGTPQGIDSCSPGSRTSCFHECCRTRLLAACLKASKGLLLSWLGTGSGRKMFLEQMFLLRLVFYKLNSALTNISNTSITHYFECCLLSQNFSRHFWCYANGDINIYSKIPLQMIFVHPCITKMRGKEKGRTWEIHIPS